MAASAPAAPGASRRPPPAGLEPGSPFGPNLRAFVLYLRFGQAIPFERLERLMRDLFGLEISEGALANLLEDSAPAFEVQTSRIKQRLLSGTALESDETSVRVGKTTFWTWVFHHADSACFVIRPSRGKAVVREFLGDFRPEFWVSDRLGAQMGWATKDHQVCLAHLLRDIQYAIDAGDDAFAPGMKALLKRAVRIGRRRPALAESTLVTYHSRLQAKLDELLKIVPDNQVGTEAPAHHQALPPKPVRLRHQPRHSTHQQWLRTGPAALRRLPQDHQLLPIPVGRSTLRQRPIRRRNRPTKIDRHAPGHPPHPRWTALADCCMNPLALQGPITRTTVMQLAVDAARDGRRP